MRWEHVEELRADPGIAPAERNRLVPKGRSMWPAIMVVTAAAAFGVVIWLAYQNGRETSENGAPPLIKADASPVKVKPDDPGGQEFPFQDSTVYDRLDQNGQKQPAMEKLLPPPEAPVERAPPPVAAEPAAPPPVAVAPALADAAVLAPKLAQPATAPAVIAQPVPGPAPATSPPAPALTVPPAAAQPDPIGALAAAAIASSPAHAAAKPAPAPAAATAPAPAKPVAAGGGYRIQIGAVKTADAVGPEWARLKHRFPDALSSLKVSSDKVELAGKGTFYRIQAGPLDEGGAKSACDHLKAQGVGCIVVK